MKPRLNPFAAAAAAMQAWFDFGKAVLQCGLEESLMELVKIRASQINGCAFCLHMHTQGHDAGNRCRGGARGAFSVGERGDPVRDRVSRQPGA